MLLTSLLKVFCLFMVKFYYKQIGTYHDMFGFSIKCVNFKQVVYCKMEHGNNKDYILVFIRSILSQHVGITCLIETKWTTGF